MGRMFFVPPPLIAMKENKKEPIKALRKPFTSEELRDWLREKHATLEPEAIFRDLDKLIEKKEFGEKFDQDRLSKKMDEAMMMVMGHERHYLLAESVTEERWRSMVIDLANCIQKEYSCVTSSEIALSGLAANAYYRSLRMARRLDGFIWGDGLSTAAIPLVSHLSKEIDRADRQYLAVVQTLRERREPKMSVRIQTRAAFFGNQTINTHAPSEPYEINDPQ